MNFLIRNNLFIGLCAASLTLATHFLLIEGNDLLRLDYLLFVFFATVFGYSILRNGKFILKKDFPLILRTIIALSGIVASGLAIIIPWSTDEIILLFILLILCAWYGMHWEGGIIGKLSLRQPGWIKLMTIGFVWTSTTVLMPLLLTEQQFIGKREWVFFAQQMVFIIMITIPFDLKDHIREKALGFRSLPVVVGEDNAKRIGRILALVFWALAGFGGMATLITGSICAILYLSWLNKGVDELNLNQLTLKFDGIMIIEALLLIGLYLYL